MKTEDQKAEGKTEQSEVCLPNPLWRLLELQAWFVAQFLHAVFDAVVHVQRLVLGHVPRATAVYTI